MGEGPVAILGRMATGPKRSVGQVLCGLRTGGNNCARSASGSRERSLYNDTHMPIITTTITESISGQNITNDLASPTDDKMRSLSVHDFPDVVSCTNGTANLNCLSKDMDKALDLFTSMLKTPGFQQDRIDLYKNQALQGMERRNDKTDSIQAREWGRLMRGDQHFSTIPTTKPAASIPGR